MSSEHQNDNGVPGFTAELCIDNNLHTFCHSDCSNDNGIYHPDAENCPWIALEFEEIVDVRKVIVSNRQHGDFPFTNGRLRKMQVRVTEELPQDASVMFNKGVLFGTFPGQAVAGQVITMTGQAQGRFVLIQIDNKDCLHVAEIAVFGAACTGETRQLGCRLPLGMLKRLLLVVDSWY